MTYHEKSWWLLKHFFFVFIAFHDRPWCTLNNHERSWWLLKHVWYKNYHELLWSITNPYGKILKYFVINHEKTWSVMICNITFQKGSYRWVFFFEIRPSLREIWPLLWSNVRIMFFHFFKRFNSFIVQQPPLFLQTSIQISFWLPGYHIFAWADCFWHGRTILEGSPSCGRVIILTSLEHWPMKYSFLWVLVL